MNKQSFEEKLFSGYTKIPNDLIRMRRDEEITRIEFEVLHIIFAFKNFKYHNSSCRQIAKLIGGVNIHTVLDALKSLEEKKFIRIEKIDSHYSKYHLLLLVKEITVVEKTEDSQFDFNASEDDDGLENNEEKAVPVEAQSCASRSTGRASRSTEAVPLGAHIELRSRNNKKKERIEKTATPTTSPQKILELFNTKCKNSNDSLIPRATILSTKRRNAVKILSNRLLKEYSDWEKFIEKIFSSDFLKGKNRQQWHATIDWVLNETNAIKILDGNFDNKLDQSSLAAKKIDDILEAKRNELRQQNLSGAAT